MSDPIIDIQGVNKWYGSGSGKNQVLHEVDLQINEGELVSIVGTSGSGKSTLLNIIGGLDRDYTGRVQVFGQDYGRLSDRKISRIRNDGIGFIFQAFNLLDHLTCWENVALPAFFSSGSFKGAQRRSKEGLERVGLTEKVSSKPSALSGGQKQRVAIARALYVEPRLLLCDEPTGNLDSETGRQIIELFKKLNEQDGITLVIVTHEARVSNVADRIIRLEDGRVLNTDAELDANAPGIDKNLPVKETEELPDAKSVVH